MWSNTSGSASFLIKQQLFGKFSESYMFDKKLETNPPSRFTAVFLAHFSVSLLCHLFSDRNPGPAVMSLAFIFDRRGGRKKKLKQTWNLFFFFFSVTFTVSDEMFALPRYRANTPVLNRNWLQTGAQWRLNTAPLCLLCHPHILHIQPPNPTTSDPPSFCAVFFFLLLFPFFFTCDILFTWVSSRQHQQ